jgi:hypothetical protein
MQEKFQLFNRASTDLCLSDTGQTKSSSRFAGKNTVCVCLCGSVANFLQSGCRLLDANRIAASYFALF